MKLDSDRLEQILVNLVSNAIRHTSSGSITLKAWSDKELFTIGGKAMNTCPYCSHNLLRHLRSQEVYWYCQHCRLESRELKLPRKQLI
ncbi:MAG: hypothetical protein AB4038_18040 [Prochloraceae cyanobacterium]